MQLSPKQKEFWNAPFHRWNIKHGATRTGKTYLDYFIIPRRIRERMGKEGLVVLLGNTKGTLQRNVIEPMQDIYGASIISSIRSDNTATIFGERVHCLGADNKKHVDRLRGTSIKYCYGDEVVTWEREVFEMLKSRLDKPYSCFDGTCNPGGPAHWLKAFLDGDADIFQQNYQLDDNPFLDPVVAGELKKEHAGVFYDRYILGRWVQAEGIIYPMFSTGEGGHVVDASQYTYTKYYISVDYGTMNPFSAGLWGKATEGAWVRIREYYHDGRNQKKQLTDEEYHDALVALSEDLPNEVFPETKIPVIIDPSAASFIACLRKHGCFAPRHAVNNVLDGIRKTAVALQKRQILIDRSCEATVNEFHSYVWDEKADQDKPLKQNDHAMDDIRYMVNTIIAVPDLYSFATE